MRQRILGLILFGLLGSTSLCFAQDLNKLPDRATQLWELRKQRNTLGALPLIEPQRRQTYLDGGESPFISFRISGIEFTDNDPSRVTVVTTVHFTLPRVGDMDRTVREPWVWKDGEWFMSALAPMNLFAPEAKPAEPEHIPPEFSVTNSTIDVGRHSQGDTVEGKIPFHAVRGEIKLIHPLQTLTGLIIETAVWSSPTEGYLPYSWDMTLVSKDINDVVTLEAKATSDEKATLQVRFLAKVDGKVAFHQDPEVVDTQQAGKLEIRIQNLSTKPLKVLTATSYNQAFVIDDVTEAIDPGATGRMVIHYPAQSQAAKAAIGVVLSEKLGRTPVTMVPLKTKLPEPPDSPVIPKQEIERLIKANPQPVLPSR
jgi:hypothetical protein